MVRHQPLQYYEPQLCLSCLTGIYGCRWKRYQRSHDDTTPWERLWFLLLTFTFGLTLTWLYFWWEVHNDYDEFNWCPPRALHRLTDDQGSSDLLPEGPESST